MEFCAFVRYNRIQILCVGLRISVVVKKEEKVNKVFDVMSDIHDMQEFKNMFKEMYPDDWKRIISTYNKEERKDTKGKGHQMPKPEIYLSNMYKVSLKKRGTEGDNNDGTY